MFEHARGAFAAAGIAPYEISSYARPDRQSRHNGLYWSLSPYLGVGASAASFRPLADGTAWRFSDPSSSGRESRPARAKLDPNAVPRSTVSA